jgi:hypothetical protein
MIAEQSTTIASRSGGRFQGVFTSQCFINSNALSVAAGFLNSASMLTSAVAPGVHALYEYPASAQDDSRENHPSNNLFHTCPLFMPILFNCFIAA